MVVWKGLSIRQSLLLVQRVIDWLILHLVYTTHG